jgi:hypothetical protein
MSGQLSQGSQTGSAKRSPASNPAFIAMIALPVFAVVASLGAAVAAYRQGDPELPPQYHWEGAQLDLDFAAAQRAFELNVRASLQVLRPSGVCRVVLKLDSAPPTALTLSLVHGSRPELDQRLRLLGRAGTYEAPCALPSAAHWHAELADDPVTWRVRQDLTGPLTDAGLSARAPQP